MNVNAESLKRLPAAPAYLNDASYAAAYDDASALGSTPRFLLVPPTMKEHAVAVVARVDIHRPAGSKPMQGVVDVRWDAALSDAPRRWYVISDNGAVARECPEAINEESAS